MAVASQLQRKSQRPDIAMGIDRARDLAVQQVAAATPIGNPQAVAAAQAAAPQIAAQSAAQKGQAILQQGQQQAGTAQVQASAQQAAQQKAQGERALDMQSKAMQNEQALSQMSSSAKQKIFDDRVQFQSQEIGRGVLQESQLLDWAVQKSKNAEELKNYTQEVEQATQKRLAFLEAGWKKMENALRASADGRIQTLDQEQRLRLERAAYDFKMKYAKEKAKAQAKKDMVTGALTVGGMIVGGMAGGPQGAMMGGQVGGSVGQMGASESIGGMF